MMKNILIADDDAAIRASLGRVLVHGGHEVTLAADGLEARARLLERHFDMLILDLDMPVRDGWDVLDDVQTIDPCLPVIVLTGVMDQLSSFELDGVDALMGKPVDAERLLATVERLLAEGSHKKNGIQEQDPPENRNRRLNRMTLKKAIRTQAQGQPFRNKPQCV